MAILDRNLTLECNEETAGIYDFLVNKLKVPTVWIHDALANKAKLSSSPWIEFQHLLYAQSYHNCHEVAIRHIIPNLLANQQHEVAKKILLQMEENHEYILSWKDQGGLLLEFLRLRDSVEENSREKNRGKTIRLQSALFKLCQRVKYFPTESAEQTLCISEVSKSCAEFLQTLFHEDGDKRSQIHANAMCIEELVMPADYKSLDFEKYMVEYLKI